MYRITARGHGLKPVEVPLDVAWDLDVNQTKRAIELMQPSVVYVASPNNPTGNRMTDGRVRDVVTAAKDAVAIVDEAYVDYAGPQASVRRWRPDHRHLGILRTVSKIGLAALRVGWLEADAGIVAELDKVRQPLNVSATSQAAAAAVLEECWDEVQADVARVVAARDSMARAIAELPGLSVTPSAANFLWVKTSMPAEQVFSALVADKILVRSFHASGGRMASQLRITVGTGAENARLLESLGKTARRA
jgi:histidinol-phosphate aminotransferase